MLPKDQGLPDLVLLAVSALGRHNVQLVHNGQVHPLARVHHLAARGPDAPAAPLNW
ncbi:hypothetical protein MITS9504_03535 [Synechococcus sp. MIT S9504]|nr:hypothetical protein MITS9504_03535 [Synechococcus sp. MIT S9504]